MVGHVVNITRLGLVVLLLGFVTPPARADSPSPSGPSPVARPSPARRNDPQRPDPDATPARRRPRAGARRGRAARQPDSRAGVGRGRPGPAPAVGLGRRPDGRQQPPRRQEHDLRDRSRSRTPGRSAGRHRGRPLPTPCIRRGRPLWRPVVRQRRTTRNLPSGHPPGRTAVREQGDWTPLADPPDSQEARTTRTPAGRWVSRRYSPRPRRLASCPPRHVEEVEMNGHIIDSLLLPKVLDDDPHARRHLRHQGHPASASGRPTRATPGSRSGPTRRGSSTRSSRDPRPRGRRRSTSPTAAPSPPTSTGRSPRASTARPTTAPRSASAASGSTSRTRRWTAASSSTRTARRPGACR